MAAEINTLDNSILIIGHGETDYRNKEIIKCGSLDKAEYMYGKNSDIYAAYKELSDITSADVYTCSCFLFTDYISVLSKINENFNYICPLFNFSEFYRTNSGSKVYLAELYSNIIANGLTEIIFTDKHASYYEDIEQYIKEMNKINTDFKSLHSNNLEFGENLCFVLNNLQNYKFANVILAGILTQTDFKYYPKMNVGDVVFDLNNNDFYNQEIIYFAYNNLSGTTIENFLNFRKNPGPEKFVPVHMVIQKIKRGLDFSDFIGQLFNRYTQIQIENLLEEEMNSFVGVLIQSYKVKKLLYQKVSNGNDIVIKIIIEISILPYNSIESIDLNMEV